MAEDPLKLEERRIWEWRNILSRNLLKKPPGKFLFNYFPVSKLERGLTSVEKVTYFQLTFLKYLTLSKVLDISYSPKNATDI